MRAIRHNLEKIKIFFATFLLIIMQLAPLAAVSQPVSATQEKVTICHRTAATTNPYRQITVNISAVDGKDNGDHYLEHTGPIYPNIGADGKWGDIIPPIPGMHNGLNWYVDPTADVLVDNEEAQAIWNNDCQLSDVDSPTLSLVKNVDGGDAAPTAWDLTATPVDDNFETVSGAGGFPATEVASDIFYTLSESTGPDGYTPGPWQCEETSGQDNFDLDNGNQVMLGSGANVVCTITNTHEPSPTGTVVVRKVVRNNNGGSAKVGDFELFVNQTQVVSDDENTFPTNVDYTVSENPLVDGYAMTSISCWDITRADGLTTNNRLKDKDDNSKTFTFELQPEQKVFCKIVNNDKPGHIKIFKRLINDNNGQAKAGDFTYYIDKEEVKLGEWTTVDSGMHTVREDLLPGYEQLSIACWDNATNLPVAHPVDIQLGQWVKCLITNNDVPPVSGTITVTKHVKNDDGGNANVRDFLLRVNDTLVRSGKTNSFEPGIYGVGEIPLVDGYRQTLKGCRDADTLKPVTLPFRLHSDQNIECLIVNDDMPARITVFKDVTNDDDGQAKPGDFPLFVNRTRVRNGATRQYDGNTRYFVHETQLPGYEQTGLRCYDRTAKTVLTNPFIAQNGHSIVCTIFNDDIAPTLQVIKYATNDDGGTVTADQFSMYYSSVDGTVQLTDPSLGGSSGSDTTSASYEATLSANQEYTVFEDQENGYQLTNKNCYNITDKTNWIDLSSTSFTAQPGESYLCEFSNDDIAPQVTVVKHTIPPRADQTFKFVLKNDDNKYRFKLDTNPATTRPDRKTITSLTAGTVKIKEKNVTDWSSRLIICFDGPQRIGDVMTNLTKKPNWPPFAYALNSNQIRLKVGIGDKITCHFLNEADSSIKVTKFHDLNENGIWDEGEPALPGWDINLNTFWRPQLSAPETDLLPQTLDTPMIPGPKTTTQTTGEDGSTTFTGTSMFRHYSISEDLQDGWLQTGMYCNNQEESDSQVKQRLIDHRGGSVEVLPGKTTECFIGNAQEAEMTIEKTNDTTDAVAPGSTVTYTITVTNPDTSGLVSEVNVGDVLPNGFNFGSALSVVSSVNGDITGSVTVNYTDGVGNWSIGDMAVGEIITITYTATVGDSVSPGAYDNIAYATAQTCTEFVPMWLDDGLLAPNFEAFPPIDYQLPFQVQCAEEGYENVIATDASPDVEEGPDYFAESTVKVAAVLGTSDHFVLGLVNTGSPAILPTIVGLTLVTAALGLGAVQNRRFRRFFKRFAKSGGQLLVAVFATLLFSTHAFAISPSTSPWQLSVADLVDNTQASSVEVGYQIAAVGNDSFNVTLSSDGPNTNDQVIGPVADSGSHNGTFTVNLPVDGTYEITVTADNTSDGSDDSFVQTIVRDTTAPAAPDYSGVVRDGDQYTLTFTVPSGSDASIVQIYGSTATEFDTNSTTLLGSVPATPGTAQTFVYNAPDDTARFFALNASDTAGNVSPLVGDISVVNEVVQGATVPSSPTNGNVDNEAAQSERDVEGAQQENQENNEEADDSNILLAIGGIVGAVIVAAGILYFTRRSTDTN